MRPFALFIGGIFTSAVAANVFLGENAFELMTFDSARSFGEPALHSRSLQARQACMATCANGGCCNTGGPCTTDGMCCAAGEMACTDGGCCRSGETCTSVNNTQVCRGTVSCKAPPVPCGPACCDAGTLCVASGANYRCQLPAQTTSSSTKPTTSSFSHPPLGNPTNRTNTASISFTGVLSGTKVVPYVTPTTFPPTNTATAAATSSSSSSAAKQSIQVSGLQMLINILGGIGLVAALALIN